MHRPVALIRNLCFLLTGSHWRFLRGHPIGVLKRSCGSSVKNKPEEGPSSHRESMEKADAPCGDELRVAQT